MRTLALVVLLVLLAGCEASVTLKLCPDGDTVVESLDECPGAIAAQSAQGANATCPQSCDDANRCTQDLCSEQTGFSCMHRLIDGCCNSRQDCPGQTPYCVEARCHECVLNAHCPAQRPFCIEHTCAPTKACDSSTDCPSFAPNCINTTCVDARCDTSSDCPSYLPHCVRSHCLAVACVDVRDCEANHSCVVGTCLQQCASDADCSSITSCVDGHCIASPLLADLKACTAQPTEQRIAACIGIVYAEHGLHYHECTDLYNQGTQQSYRLAGWCLSAYVYAGGDRKACHNIQPEDIPAISNIRIECYDQRINWTGILNG